LKIKPAQTQKYISKIKNKSSTTKISTITQKLKKEKNNSRKEMKIMEINSE